MRGGNRVSNNFFKLIFIQSKVQVSRFAFVVPIRVDKRASARNRVKRLLRESIHHVLPRIAGAFDAVLIVQKKPNGMSQLQVKEMMQDMLRRAKLIKL